VATAKRKIKKEEADAEVALLHQKLEGYSKMKICGSFRRNLKTVGDIDVVVSPANEDNPEFLISSIKALAKEVMSDGKKIVRIVTENDVQVDFYITNEKFFDSHVLFLTGSKGFNIKCRSLAKQFGMRLSQYGLVDERGEVVAISEDDILSKIGLMDFIHPEARSI